MNTAHPAWHLIDDIFERLTPSLRAMFRRYVGRSDIDDLVSETRLRMEEYRSSWHPGLNSERWIRAVGRFVLLEYGKSHQRRRVLRKDRFFPEYDEEDEDRCIIDADLAHLAPRARLGDSDHVARLLVAGKLRREDGPTSDYERPEAVRQEEREILWNSVRDLDSKGERERPILALRLAGLKFREIARAMVMDEVVARATARRARAKHLARMRMHPDHPDNADRRDLRPLWTATQLQAARAAWDWIGALSEPAALSARLMLFGGVTWSLLARAGFSSDLEPLRLRHYDDLLTTAGWN